MEPRGPPECLQHLQCLIRWDQRPQNFSFPRMSFPTPQPALHSWITIPFSSEAKQTLVACHASLWPSQHRSSWWPVHISFWPEKPLFKTLTHLTLHWTARSLNEDVRWSGWSRKNPGTWFPGVFHLPGWISPASQLWKPDFGSVYYGVSPGWHIKNKDSPEAFLGI